MEFSWRQTIFWRRGRCADQIPPMAEIVRPKAQLGTGAGAGAGAGAAVRLTGRLYLLTRRRRPFYSQARPRPLQGQS